MISVDLVVLTHLVEQVDVGIPIRHTGNLVPLQRYYSRIERKPPWHDGEYRTKNQ